MKNVALFLRQKSDLIDLEKLAIERKKKLPRWVRLRDSRRKKLLLYFHY